MFKKIFCFIFNHDYNYFFEYEDEVYCERCDVKLKEKNTWLKYRGK